MGINHSHNSTRSTKITTIDIVLATVHHSVVAVSEL